MERPIFKPIGTPTEQLDTPTLVVELDALAHNIEAVHSFFREREAKLRPHVEAHGCPGIAHRQLASAGTVGGVSVSTVGEAEVFAQAGISDITVANEVVTPQKIARLCALARSCRVTVAVDNPRVVERTSRAARTRASSSASWWTSTRASSAAASHRASLPWPSPARRTRRMACASPGL